MTQEPVLANVRLERSPRADPHAFREPESVIGVTLWDKSVIRRVLCQVLDLITPDPLQSVLRDRRPPDVPTIVFQPLQF